MDEMLAQREVEHLELRPGDVVYWHSSLWHCSPVNTSPQGSIGMAGVYTTPDLVRRSERSWGALPWVLRGGKLCAAFPPEEFEVVNGSRSEPEQHPRA